MSLLVYLFTFSSTMLSLKYMYRYFIIERNNFLLEINNLNQDIIILKNKVQDLDKNVYQLKKVIDNNIKLDNLIISEYDLI